MWEIFVRGQMQFQALEVLRSKSRRKQTPLLKKIGVCFLQLFYPDTLRASNCNPTAHNFFMHSIFMILAS